MEIGLPMLLDNNEKFTKIDTKWKDCELFFNLYEIAFIAIKKSP